MDRQHACIHDEDVVNMECPCVEEGGKTPVGVSGSKVMGSMVG